jgi:hypothetical protein
MIDPEKINKAFNDIYLLVNMYAKSSIQIHHIRLKVIMLSLGVLNKIIIKSYEHNHKF